ncbi:hypothetical protein LJR038_005048 [Acidovorax sp. LjRoot38]|uniref:hypothetical protein n=1 Tax=Acidovorax sp. LjRoot38 TaxID=3342327 RepID=UPI003ED16395
MTQYTQHPLSAAFPPLSADEFTALRDSISDLGVQNPITIFEGQVLDGWNRYCAACELGMECPERELESWVDPRAFVLAQNKARRHLTIAQMSMAAAAVYEWRGVGRPSGNSALSAELRQSEVAEQAGVSVRSLRQADAVMSDAVPAVVAAVKSGEMGLAKASAIAKLPQEQQVDAIHKPMREIVSVPEKGANTAAGTALDIDDSRGIDPAPAQSAPAVEPLAPEYSELDAARDQIADLQAALALANLGDVPEADRNQAAELIEQLQGEVKGLSAQLRAVTSSRDFLMQENTQMKQQLAAQRREIDRLKAVAA